MPFDSTDFKLDTVVDINTKTGKLNHLIKILQSVPPNRFNMKSWRCGTSACAAGWAGMDYTFNRMGFFSHDATSELDELCYCSPEGKQFKYFQACEQFFELNEWEAEYLFYPNVYSNNSEPITPQRVISRIQSLLEGQLNYAI